MRDKLWFIDFNAIWRVSLPDVTSYDHKNKVHNTCLLSLKAINTLSTYKPIV